MLSLTRSEDRKSNPTGLSNEFSYQGKSYKLDLSFDTVISFYQLLDDEHFTAEEKASIAFEMFFGFEPKNPEFTISAFEQISSYLRQQPYGNDVEEDVGTDMQGNSISAVKYYSFTQDAEAIYSSFREQYGINLLKEKGKMHWDEFKALFAGLSDKTYMSRIIQIRMRDTSELKENQLALVGEEGFELAHTPRGYEVLGADGPEVRYLSAGTSILTHAQSTAAMAMNGGKLPGYAKGTGAKIEDFIDSAKDGMEEAFDLIGKGASEIWDWLKEKTGLDKMLGSQPSMGGIKRTTKGSFDYAKNAISSYIKKMADKFMDSIGGGGKMSKEAFAKAAQVAAALMHQSLSASDIERLYWQAMVESTVNPAQGGGIDDHDGTGRPIGLFQFKLGTWGAAVRHLPAGHSNIHSAVDQIMGVLADSTWRSDLAPIGVRRGWSPQSYANGGWAHKLSIFGEVPGEPELAVNPARDSSEDHIAEAIEARAKINPNGFAGTLSKLIESVKNSANSLVPVINQGTSQVRTAGSVANRQVKIDGNMNVVMNVDGKTIGHVTYATWRAIRSHELNIQANGGAIPVGGARPLGGVY